VKINEDFIGDIRSQHKSGRTTVDVIIDSDSKVRLCKFSFIFVHFTFFCRAWHYIIGFFFWIRAVNFGSAITKYLA
jgi:hypothetical protein